MTLHKRLTRLEAQRQGMQDGPRVIVFDACWRDDDGNLQSIAQMGYVLTGSGWESVTRKDDEPEAEFQLRAEMLSGDADAGSAWAMAALRRKHATPDPA